MYSLNKCCVQFVNMWFLREKNEYIYKHIVRHRMQKQIKFMAFSYDYQKQRKASIEKKNPEPWKYSIIIIHNLSLTVLLSNSLFLVGVRSCFPFKSNTLLKYGNVHGKNLTSDFLHTFSILISTQPVTVSVSASAF